MEDGSERPIAFASRKPSPAEKNYSQLEKEGLAIIFWVKKFHIHLYGRHFTIHSDHQPLKHIFGDKKGIALMAASRIQRWALTLSAYEYNIEYCPGNKLQNADVLSRLPLNRETHVPLPGDIQQHLNTRSPVMADKISAWTEKDPILSWILSSYREDGLDGEGL